MLRTRLTTLFDLTYPIVSAPMAMHTGGTLAAAVSEAGGLGTFGGIHEAGPDWVREQVGLVRSKTERPFGVGFITPFLPFMEANFDVAIEERVPVIALSFSDPQPWLDRAKAAGAVVMCQVQTFAQAREAVDAGADVVVAQGNEAGGHTGTMNLLPLLTQVIDAFPDVPVLASGGISRGRALAAVLAAGAEGAWAGTPFLATPEAVEVAEVYKERIVASDGADTVFTRVYDIVDGLPWPQGIGGRVYNGRFVREWDGRDGELAKRQEELRRVLQDAYQRDTEMAAVYMGQSVGAVTAVRPAAEVLRELCDDAERVLRERARAVLE